MSELPAIAAAARRLVALGESGLLATLVGVRGSSYRPRGAMMLVTPAGHRIGGVSGGCLEEYVAREGRRRLTGNGRGADAPGRGVVLRFDTAHDPEDVLAEPVVPVPGCGGQLDVLVEALTPRHAAWLSAGDAARREGTPIVLGCVLVADDPVEGDSVTVRRFLASGDVTAPERLAAAKRPPATGAVRRLAARVLTTRRTFQGAIDFAEHGHSRFRDGSVRAARPASGRWASLRFVEPATSLVICGAGDDAQALVAQAKLLGWHVTVLDRRGRLATAARFPLADVVLDGQWHDLLQRARPRRDAAVVVMTHSFADDVAILTELSRRTPAYVGLLGPASRRDAVLAEAAAVGAVITAPFIARLHGPAGLNLGVKSPEAIALSIASEILATTSDPHRRVPSRAFSKLRVPANA